MHFRTFSESVYINRRAALVSKMDSGVILLMGNNESPKNFKDNTFSFRQDSSFLYYFGLDVAGLTALIDIDSEDVTIFGNELSIDDIVWTGPLHSVKEMATSVGVQKVQEYGQLAIQIEKCLLSKRKLHFLPPYRHDIMIMLQSWLNIPIDRLKEEASLPLIKAIVSQRSIKEDCEIGELRKAVSTTCDMHRMAMHYAKPGMKEYEIVAKLHEMAIKDGGQISFTPIVTVNGETLHNHYYGNTIKEGQMVLCDAGAESDMHYAGDMTCTFPVGKTFTTKQSEIYQIVLDAHESSVKMLKPGVFYKDVYLNASQVIVKGLIALDLMKGDASEAVEAGAHAMFFQCGLGHMMGLDVHDMEDLGEQYVGYTDDLLKSTQFGMKSLRLGKNLEPGYVLTVEPGIYFIPSLIDMWKAEKKFDQFINYQKLETYKDFSGIRVEEDFVITESGASLLGGPLPKTIAEIEEVRKAVF